MFKLCFILKNINTFTVFHVISRQYFEFWSLLETQREGNVPVKPVCQYSFFYKYFAALGILKIYIFNVFSAFYLKGYYIQFLKLFYRINLFIQLRLPYHLNS